MEPFYFDPLHDQLDSLETSIERTFDPGLLRCPEPDEFMDPLGRALSWLEVGIEGTEVSPPDLGESEPLQLPQLSGERPLQGPVCQRPPALSEPADRPWPGLIPPPAARPFFTREGLTLFSYRPRGRAGTRIRNDGASASTRWCVAAGEFVTEETCIECHNWGDHGSGFECYYDWLDRNMGRTDELKDEDDEY